MGRLSDTVAIITGAGSGFGKATARLFGAEGASVLCADLNGEEAAETAALVDSVGGTGAALSIDVSSFTATEAMAHIAKDTFGRIDVLFANAGINRPASAHLTEEADWNRVIATDLTGVWLCARAVLPQMLRQQSGSIINTASVAGMIGETNDAAYAAAKGGVIALTRQMAVDYGSDGIRVNAISPGLVATPFARSVFAARESGSTDDIDARLKRAAERFPLKRLGSPEDVARLVLFLASQESAWITGTVIPVDGGLSSAARVKT